MIKKIVIDIDGVDGVTYEMNYTQAEKLYGGLSKIFEKKIEYVPSNPYQWPNYPQYPHATLLKDNSGTPPPNPVMIQYGSDYKIH
jgi:hypothetical protein